MWPCVPSLLCRVILTARTATTFSSKGILNELRLGWARVRETGRLAPLQTCGPSLSQGRAPGRRPQPTPEPQATVEPGPGTPARTAAERLQLLAHHGHRGQASCQGQTLFVGETRRKRTLYRIKTFIQNKRSPEEGRGLVRAGRQRVQKGLKATASDLQIKTAQDCAHWPRNVVSAPKTKVSVQAAGAGSPCDQSLRAEGTDPLRPPQPPRPDPALRCRPGDRRASPGHWGGTWCFSWTSLLRHSSLHCLLAAKCLGSSGTLAHMAWTRSREGEGEGKLPNPDPPPRTCRGQLPPHSSPHTAPRRPSTTTGPARPGCEAVPCAPSARPAAQIHVPGAPVPRWPRRTQARARKS